MSLRLESISSLRLRFRFTRTVVEAHHTPGTGGVIDEDAVRQIVADSLSPGSARGVEFARTPTSANGGDYCEHQRQTS